MSVMHKLGTRERAADTYAATLDDIANRTAGRYPILAAQLRQIARDYRQTPGRMDGQRDPARRPG
jgi:hypothetical protein